DGNTRHEPRGRRRGRGDGRSREGISTQPARTARRDLRNAPRRAASGLVPRDHTDVDRPALADDLVHHGASPQLAPARAEWLAENDLAHLALAGHAPEILRD